jgi:hypothetical protein
VGGSLYYELDSSSNNFSTVKIHYVTKCYKLEKIIYATMKFMVHAARIGENDVDDVGVDWRVMPGMVWIGLIWFRKRTSGVLLRAL